MQKVSNHFTLKRGSIKRANKKLYAKLTDVILANVHHYAPNGEKVIAFDGSEFAIFNSLGSAALASGISRQAISQVITGKRPSCYGWCWMYLT